MPTEGVEIEHIHHGSLAEKAGLQRGDILTSVNTHRLRDSIDFIFYGTDENLDIEFKRNGRNMKLRVKKEPGGVLGIEFKPFKIMTCRNNCIFCFVKQLPSGMRKTLYVKDEDYRMSFLYGNYITLSNLTREDKKRIIEQKLSPLYISVHSTNRLTRNRLLGNSKAPDIVKELQLLSDNKIRFNAQIVLCPGYNDDRDLRQTLGDLYQFYPYLLSVAVVPVGLTAHRRQSIRPVERTDALEALKTIESFQKRFVKRHGTPIVFGADELYLKAGLNLPPVKTYGDLHQIENGVGMIPLFLSQVKKMRIGDTLRSKRKYLTFTGTSFYPFLKKIVDKLSERNDVRIDVFPVENRFFGISVTVAGLLTGRDVIKAALDRTSGDEILLVPDVVLDGENRFLDDITLSDVEKTLGIPARKIAATPEGLIRALSQAA